MPVVAADLHTVEELQEQVALVQEQLAELPDLEQLILVAVVVAPNVVDQLLAVLAAQGL